MGGGEAGRRWRGQRRWYMPQGCADVTAASRLAAKGRKQSHASKVRPASAATSAHIQNPPSPARPELDPHLH